MAEYIERESVDNVLVDLLGDIENDEECSCEFARGFEQALSCIEDKINDISAADVRPERHGRWEKFSENTWQCTECKKLFSAEWWYCPRCGAKMDGKGRRER